MPRKLKQQWLQEYLKLTDESESPTAFNLWSGISALSASLKRRVFITYGSYKIFPNQYIVLVAPPGVGKGTAIHPATELVKNGNTVNYLHDRITAEKIVEKLAIGFTITAPSASGTGFVPIKDTTATIVSTELPVFLGASEWMMPLLCELWDRNEFEYDTKTKGSAVVKNLCVGMLAGCVPDFIRKLNRDATAAVTGGFTARCIFVYASDKAKKIAWPTAYNGGQLEKDLINDLQHIGSLQGEFMFAPDARRYWSSYYDALKCDPFESEVTANFVSRMRSHIFKLAMTLSAAESDSLCITRTQLTNAISMVEEVKKNLDITFRGVGESPLAAAQDRILKFIEAKGLVTHSEILRVNYRHITAEDLDRVMLVLKAAGKVIEKSQGNKLSYQATNVVYTSIPKPKGTP